MHFLQLLMEVLGGKSAITAAIQFLHLEHLIDRRPAGRDLA